MLAWTPGRARAAPPADGEGEVVGDAPVVLLAVGQPEVDRALRTELNDVDVELGQIELAPGSLDERIAAAEVAIAQHDASALIWIEDGSSPGQLVIHLVAREGMLRRSVGEAGADRAAGIEVAAVVVRYFVTDLVAGRPVGLQHRDADEPEDGPTLEVDPPDAVGGEPPSERGRDHDRRGPEAIAPPLLGSRVQLHLQVGYVGQAWAREQAWSNTVELGLGWRLPSAVHFGLGFQVAQSHDDVIQYPETIAGGVQIDVRRYPLAAYGGYHIVFERPRLVLDPQLRVVTEFVTRSVRDFSDPTLTIGEPLKVGVGLEPRLELDWMAAPRVSLFLAVGLRIGLTRHRYSVVYTRDDDVIDSVDYLHVRAASPVVAAGLGIFL